jgi:hypothetical protein
VAVEAGELDRPGADVGGDDVFGVTGGEQGLHAGTGSQVQRGGDRATNGDVGQQYRRGRHAHHVIPLGRGLDLAVAGQDQSA